ncbi:chromosome segregation protein SMC [Desnuesiella massiliensis]|uniref:chromosome segregation protein SMC n=1 Tax=Desnuesiella massiliensis TaxID=1650662 RepID=UPI0006E2DC04|nr:chromosome segregation protein SMC [Desnuesiella massiliensis]
MFLKSIEIRGFKSFADKTELTFKKGVTAVVGPNGSGKSNISDAIRWVLGEQSVKSLRGGKMEDVIFAGTQFRKPVGLAQVSLTLDNASKELPIDYSDVTISRRLYRSGESEYYINNTPCRLRDIHELFMDTGIGKEGYSIIGQGKIDAILSGKPEERRALLEEAAGIVKFKTRKEEAEKKLDASEQNLIRITDILATYEERIEPLRLENEKAEKFIELSNELKGTEVSLIINSIKNLDNSLLNNKNQLEHLKKETEDLFLEISTKKQSMEDLKNQLEFQEQQDNKNKSIYYESKEKIQNLMSEVQILSDRINNLKQNIKDSTEILKNYNDKLKKLQELKNTNEVETKSYQQEQGCINKDIHEIEHKIKFQNDRVVDLENEVSKRRDNEIEILRSISEIKNNKSIIENDIESLKSKVNQLSSSCENYKNSLKINEATVKMLNVEINKLSEEIESFNDNIKSNKKNMAALQEDINSKEKNLKNETYNLNKLEANHNMLSNLEKQYEGYNRSVKSLMQHMEKGYLKLGKEDCFVLGEIVTVKEKLEIAIEVALGNAISDIITVNETVAKECIEYLKKNNMGRATFLPLNIIKAKKIEVSNSIKNLNGFVGIASELVSFDKKFTSAIDYVLGRTLICDNMNNALTVAKKIDYSYRIVTLDGQIVNPGGALTGGSSYTKNISIIGRKREIEETGKNIISLKDKIGSLNLDLSNCKDTYKKLDEECLNLRDQVHFNNIEITKLQSKISSIEIENNKLNKNLETSENEIEAINIKISNNLNIIRVKVEEIEGLIGEESENKNRSREIEVELKNIQEAIKFEKENLLQLKIKKAQVDETVSNRIRDLERISNELEEIFTSISTTEEKNNADMSMIEEYTIKIKSNEEEMKNIEKFIEDIKISFEKNEVIRIALKESVKSLDNEIENLSLTSQKKDEELHKLNILNTRYELEKENNYVKLNEEIGLTFAEALELAKPVDNPDKLRQYISLLKSQISALGTVNLGAIEEYKEVKEKYYFMSAQKEDLEKAKEELLGVIEEMTDKMKRVFNENFKILREYFNDTFKELFKGGSADLILSQGDELTANIEINVQPPGKKLQNINLMSGGEKVLSAIALLFAILKMKPTPFCILDEIEAALDDANVFRYAEFLKKFSSNIQFIIITHRKGTMEASDVLYGVTMEEKGVSKIVSVDLSA